MEVSFSPHLVLIFLSLHTSHHLSFCLVNSPFSSLSLPPSGEVLALLICSQLQLHCCAFVACASHYHPIKAINMFLNKWREVWDWHMCGSFSLWAVNSAVWWKQTCAYANRSPDMWCIWSTGPAQGNSPPAPAQIWSEHEPDLLPSFQNLCRLDTLPALEVQRPARNEKRTALESSNEKQHLLYITGKKGIQKNYICSNEKSKRAFIIVEFSDWVI